MDDEELYVPDDVLEGPSVARHHMRKKSKLSYQKEMGKFTSE
jgi:hypothetical protein